MFESEILIEAARHGIRTVSVPIEARYDEDRRASHFRPLRDVTRITRMIAWRLLRGGFDADQLLARAQGAADHRR